MTTSIWIKIGLWLISKWLMKQKQKEDIQHNSPLVWNLLHANSVDSLLDIVTDETTEEAVLEILSDAKRVNIGDVVEKAVDALVKK